MLPYPDSYTLEPVHPKQLPEDYYKLLDRTRYFDPVAPHIGAAELSKMSDTLDAQVWLFQSEKGGYGFVVTQILGFAGSLKELYIWRLHGEGMFKAFSFIQGELEKFGKANGCVRVRAGIDPNLERLLVNKKTGYTVMSLMISKEI